LIVYSASGRYTPLLASRAHSPLDLLQTISLALIQGLTEFLPISSSAHLILPFQILGWPDQGLAFDTAVHLGSLLAVLWYFRLDVFSLTRATLIFVSTGKPSTESRFALNLLIASLPIIPVGLLLKDVVEINLRSIAVIAATTIIFGLLLWVADTKGRQTQADHQLRWHQALLIGIAQCFALIPGTSRSGVTMTAALLFGFDRQSASRISFLLSIPAIGGAATLKTIDLVTSQTTVDWMTLAIGCGLSAISAYACIRLFLNYITRLGFLPFVIYRLVLGAVLIALLV
jgi:undecaprenyl-diphosphatase